MGWMTRLHRGNGGRPQRSAHLFPYSVLSPYPTRPPFETVAKLFDQTKYRRWPTCGLAKNAVCTENIFQVDRYFGMNESNPITAPPSTNRAGLILYCSRISKTPTAIAAVSTPKIAAFAMVKQPASRRPIETGASPC